MQRFRVTLAYRGTHYHGWQYQEPANTWKGPIPPEGHGLPTIQSICSRTLGQILGHPVTLVGSSRTDAGVHAKAQVAHYDTDQIQIPLDGLRRAVNNRLPPDIVLNKIEPAPPGFNAILSTVCKRYQYAIHNALDRDAFASELAWHRWMPLDRDAMRAAAAHLVGEHDFASFCRPGHKRWTTTRTVGHCQVSWLGPRIVVSVEGNGFLWNMVRIIVGTLVEVGLGFRKPEDMLPILAAKDRRAAGATAPPEGLYLHWIQYGESLAPPDSVDDAS